MKKISNEELVKIKQFEDNCNEMINGKFILSDIKIAKILKSIANSKELYGYIAECLLNFDFQKEFEKAKGVDFTKNYFKMPNEGYKKVALVFCLLVEADDKRIDFYDFVVKYFKNDKNGDEYGHFTREVMIPFRDETLKNFGLYDAPTIAIEEEQIENNEQNIEIKVQLIRHIQAMINVVKISPKIADDKKEKLTVILDACVDAVRINNKKILYALEISLNDYATKIKLIKQMYEDLLNMFVKFYKEI